MYAPRAQARGDLVDALAQFVRSYTIGAPAPTPDRERGTLRLALADGRDAPTACRAGGTDPPPARRPLRTAPRNGRWPPAMPGMLSGPARPHIREAQ
jgi:hypothetical protein